MPDRLSILCVHGIGHGDVDAALIPAWRQVITAGLQRWKPGLEVDFGFLAYDEEFDHAPLHAATYAEALTRLAASGIVHGIGDLLPGTRGLSDMPALIRWTAGMIAQWATEDRLRERLGPGVRKAVGGGQPDVVSAHSLGTPVCSDASRRERGALDGRTFVTLGSQIGIPFVRDCSAGRIEALARARRWYHLYNSDDHVFTAELRIQADNFTAVETRFDKPNDPLNHDAIWYFDHANTRNSVWLDLSGARPARTLTRETQAGRTLGARPARRALLIGINAYPNPANRLEGCVNDVYLVSSVLQECGYAPEDIRVVLDERATTAGLLERFHWLLDDVQPGDERVLFYSGHGAQIPAYGPRQEVDHLNECLVPYDFDWSPERPITDKQLVGFYSQLPYDSRFAAIFDCCHSGGLAREGGLRPRGIDPPDDIRHRALRWNRRLEMWEERRLPTANRSLVGSPQFVGKSGATYRIGRGVSLRGLPNRAYDRERAALRHRGPYLPIIIEACREEELSYEYRDGATSYGAFTYSLAKELRRSRQGQRNPSFRRLVALTTRRLQALQYEQTPSLVGPRALLGRPIPWDTRRG